eukprot:474501-Hanusia_phi.AAC.1
MNKKPDLFIPVPSESMAAKIQNNDWFGLWRKNPAHDDDEAQSVHEEDMQSEHESDAEREYACAAQDGADTEDDEY